MASLLYSICGARSQPGSAHETFSKRGAEDTVRVVSSVMASGAHVLTFCLCSMYHHWSRRLFAAKKTAKDVKESLQRGKEKMSEMFEIQGQAPLYIKRSGL